MKLTTIQSESVYDTLLEKEIVFVDKSYIECKKKHYIKAYKRMLRYAKQNVSKEFKTYPFWCSFNKTSVNSIGRGSIKLVLNVPEELVLLSNYDKWVEYLDYSKADLWGKLWRESRNEILAVDGKEISIQAIIPYIKSSWVEHVEY